MQSLLVQGEIIAGRDRRLGHRRPRHHHDRSRAAARSAGRRELRSRPRRRSPARVPDQSGARRAGAAPAGVADQHARAHLRPRRRRSILDSRNLYDVLRFDLPPPDGEKPGILQRVYVWVRTLAQPRRPAALSRARRGNGKGYEEVAALLNGFKSSMVRINERGEVIVSVAVPVQRFRAVRGALMLSTQGADIDDMRDGERLAIFKVFLVAAARDGGAVVPARRHHRGPDAPPGRGRPAGAPAHPHAGRDSRFHPSARRDRPSVRLAARHDQRALQPHRGDRELRRRRRPRAEEPAHLAALGGRDAAARQDATKAAPACSPSSSTT